MANNTSTGSLYGYTEAQLLTALRSAAADLVAGKTVIEAVSGDVQSRKQMTNSPRERMQECKANLFTLYLQDTVTYAAYAGFGNEGQNIVRADFSRCGH